MSRPININDTATTAWKNKDITYTQLRNGGSMTKRCSARALSFRNDDTGLVNMLRVSMDDGATYTSLAPGESFVFKGTFTRFAVLASPASVAYTCVAEINA